VLPTPPFVNPLTPSGKNENERGRNKENREKSLFQETRKRAHGPLVIGSWLATGDHSDFM
jgi:hypothetical protein